MDVLTQVYDFALRNNKARNNLAYVCRDLWNYHVNALSAAPVRSYKLYKRIVKNPKMKYNHVLDRFIPYNPTDDFHHDIIYNVVSARNNNLLRYLIKHIPLYDDYYETIEKIVTTRNDYHYNQIVIMLDYMFTSVDSFIISSLVHANSPKTIRLLHPRMGQIEEYPCFDKIIKKKNYTMINTLLDLNCYVENIIDDVVAADDGRMLKHVLRRKTINDLPRILDRSIKFSSIKCLNHLLSRGLQCTPAHAEASKSYAVFNRLRQIVDVSDNLYLNKHIEFGRLDRVDVKRIKNMKYALERAVKFDQVKFLKKHISSYGNNLRALVVEMVDNNAVKCVRYILSAFPSVKRKIMSKACENHNIGIMNIHWQFANFEERCDATEIYALRGFEELCLQKVNEGYVNNPKTLLTNAADGRFNYRGEFVESNKLFDKLIDILYVPRQR